MKIKLLFTIYFLTISLLKAQIITTVAGTGIPGYNGDGGQATTAKLYWPWYGTSDAAGNIYIADVGNQRIRKISSAGVITTVAGNGTIGYTGDGGQASSASLNNPYGIAFSPAGDLYISDDSNNVIRKVNSAGIISTVIGTGTKGYNGDGGQASAASLNDPYGIAFDSQGNLYIADNTNNRIRKVNTAGIITTIAGNGYGGYGGDGGQATAATLNLPTAVALDASDNIYIADQSNNRIRMVDKTTGIISNVAGSGPTGYFHGSYSGDGVVATAATLNLPSDIRFDSQGNLYIADLFNQRIRKINTAGIITTIAGNGGYAYFGDGGPATAAKLEYPSSMFFDPSGNLYITDQSNQRVRKVGISTLIPDADFQVSSRTICAGASVVFSDSTTNAVVTGWQWNFPGGTLANGYTLADAKPKVIYNNPGTYAVTYTASNSSGQASITKQAYINVVIPNAMYHTNYTESFETDSVPGSDWSVSSSVGTNWMLTSSTAATGSKSVMIDNMTNTVNDTSILSSPTFNLAAIGSPVLAFSMAYQQKTTANTDKLQVFVSADCGSSWISKWARVGAALQPASISGQSTSSFVPTPNQFATYTVNINSVAASTNVMFRWVFYAGASSVGNNIYLDNINITGTATGIQNINKEKIDLTIYPNPSSGKTTISFSLSEKRNISIQVTDLIGRVVENIPVQAYPAGEANITIGTKIQYQPGIYFVNMDIDGRPVSKKLIVQ